MTNLKQRYNEVKTEYESVQKTLADLETRRADLQNSLIRLNLRIQLEDKHVTRPIPVGDYHSLWGQHGWLTSG